MYFIIKVIGLFWLARTVKAVLFWIYLWQLKEYHIGRFIDHFSTAKGKKILLNPLLAVKIILFLALFWHYYPALYILLLLYITEAGLFGLVVIKKQIKKPVLTLKTILLTGVVLLDAVCYLFFSYTYAKNIFLVAALFLVYDIFLPLIVSMIVLLIQPFFVVARNNILKKAKNKISQYKDLNVIGITGSYGKTSTKEFLHTILSTKFNVLATLDHKNSEMGIAQTILDNLTDKHQIFIVEMGAYNKGGIDLLCNMVNPSIGILTGVNEQHLSTFGSLDNLLSAEGGGELAKHLSKGGLIIVNGDNKYCLDLYKKISSNKKIYTAKKDNILSDIWAEDLEAKKESISFVGVSLQKEMAHFNVKVLGKHNIENMLAAILVAKEFGMTMEEISNACENITQAQAGITLNTGTHGINIIDSSYSSNPDGVVADLDYLSIFSGNPSTGLRARKVIVMPCLIELGNKSSEIHRQLGKKIAQICDLAIITTKDKFKEVSEGFMNEGLGGHKILLCENPKEIFTLITMTCKEGDAVLLEGRVPGELIKLLYK